MWRRKASGMIYLHWHNFFRSSGTVRGPASLPESNRVLVKSKLHDWCFRLARQAPLLWGRTAGGGSKDRCTGRGGSSVSSALRTTATIASILRDASGGNATEPMFAYEDREVPGKVCCDYLISIT